MKKFLFLGIAATAMLASCTNDEVVEMNPQNAIGFESFVDKSTRATDITTENLQEFNVWAYQGANAILNPAKVSKTITNSELTSDWRYEDTQYWVVGQNYNFHAIAPITCQSGDTYTYGGTSTGVSIDFTNGAGLTDLIYNNQSVASATANQGVVAFTFDHLLSRVRFHFTESFENDQITVQVTNLKINKIASKAVYTGTWAPSTETTVDYTFTGAPGTAWTSEAISDHLYFIPNTQNLNITFTVQAFQAGVPLAEPSNKTATIQNYAMESGKSYEFTTNFSIDNVTDEDDKPNPIEFTVTKVEEWEDWPTNGTTVTPAE